MLIQVTRTYLTGHADLWNKLDVPQIEERWAAMWQTGSRSGLIVALMHIVLMLLGPAHADPIQVLAQQAYVGVPSDQGGHSASIAPQTHPITILQASAS